MEKKKKENYYWQKYIPRLWCPQMSPKGWEIFHFLYFIFAANTTRAFNIYFHSHPHALFLKSEYTRTQMFGDNIGSRGTRFSHNSKEKKGVSNFSQIVSKLTLIPSQSVDSTLYPWHLYLLAEKCGMFSKDFSRVFSRVRDPDQGQRSVAINRYE